MTVSFHTLGCKLNFAETSTIGRLFAENGYTRVDFGQPADVVVINTCTVTGQADRKCRQAIGKAVKTSPDAVVVVVGCFAELKNPEVANIPGVSLVLGNKDKFNIIEHINQLKGIDTEMPSCGCDAYRQFFPACSLFDRTRSFLKVQDGCDYRCTYCTIPKARGQSRNAPIDGIVKQAEAVAGQGIREIVLTGVNIGDFGRTTGETFLQLLRALDAVGSIRRIRIGSVEPNLITEEIIALVAGSQKLAPHFHIPLQSGCNRILHLMARRYRRELFAEKVRLIHQYIPRAGIGADVITGFPGETDEDFEDTLNFIENLDLAYLHVFPYSERPGTKAVELPGKVKPADAEHRSKKLLELSITKRQQFYRQHTGQRLGVIFEQRAKGGMMTGFTDSYVKVEAPCNAFMIGKYMPVALTGIGKSGNMTGIIAE
ncbi:MAG: tRNA (N(6)-L-threonylcarbamoyladenosine(37)-C(2))-methylthiotransferase MtaB [Bacteroidales bacterium]|jgi:threonylcarbamoyladenosine tRNA methylthiotransferase MtaB|nr:tRNA (N(6)-L-threonylcarbamoyladenosine(37)-C(2))-methylthiotransferase MtaB [Bacteroidales bacterium]